MNFVSNLLFGLAAALAFLVAVQMVLRLPVFPLRQVVVGGDLKHVNLVQVEEIVKGHLRGNFFSVDLAATRAAFQKLPWVREVQVRRRWPDQLDIALEEHEVLARWGNEKLVNTYGELFDAATDDSLPVLNGPSGTAQLVTQRYTAFFEMLMPINMRPVSVTLSARYAWQLKLSSGLTVELGREQNNANSTTNLVLTRLSRFTAIYPTTLARLNRKFDYVDLRYPSGFALRAPGAISGIENKPEVGKKPA